MGVIDLKRSRLVTPHSDSKDAVNSNDLTLAAGTTAYLPGIKGSCHQFNGATYYTNNKCGRDCVFIHLII